MLCGSGSPRASASWLLYAGDGCDSRGALRGGGAAVVPCSGSGPAIRHYHRDTKHSPLYPFTLSSQLGMWHVDKTEAASTEGHIWVPGTSIPGTTHTSRYVLCSQWLLPAGAW